MELKDYLAIMRRRSLWFVGFTGVVMAAYAWVSGREAPSFRASAQIRVAVTDYDTRTGRIAPLYPVQQPFYTFRARLDSIKSESYLWAAWLLYQAFGAKAADTGGVEWKTRTVAEAEAALQALDDPSVKDVTPETREQVTKRFGQQVTVQPGAEGTQTASITVERDNPVEAREMASAVARAAELMSVEESLEGLNALRRHIVDAIAVRNKDADERARNVGGVDDVEQKRDQLQQVNAALERFARETEAKEAEIERLRREIERETIQETFDGAVGGTAAVTATTQPLYEQYQTRISAVDQELVELRRVLQEEHPKIAVQKEKKQRLVDDMNRALRQRRQYGIADRLRQQQELALERDQLTSRTRERREEKVRIETDLGRRLPIWEKVRQLKTEVKDHETRLGEIDAVIHYQRGSPIINVQKYPGRPEEFYRNKQQSLPFWILIAVCVGAGAAYVREYLDTAIATEYDVRRHINLPVIGIVPEVGGGEEIILTRIPVKAPLSEIFNTAATILRTTMIEGGMKTLVITSANPREGKTTVAINLSVALARKGLRTILVDTDLRLPQLHHWLGLPNTAGVSTVIEQRLQAMEQIDRDAAAPPPKPAEYLATTEVPNLFILPSGPIPTSPVHVIESKAMRELVDEMRTYADIVIFDSPPICTVSDGLSLATVVDACLFVVGAGYCERREATWAKHLLANVQARTLGVLLNRSKILQGVEYYYYYGYYGYTEGRRKSVRTRT